MPSTYLELYSDFQEEVKLYHEQATFTERSFMRRITTAAQEFQKRTKIVETEKQLFRANNFYLGDDILEIIEVCDQNDNNFFSMEFGQFRSEVEKLPTEITPLTDSEGRTVVPIGRLFEVGNRAETKFFFDINRHPPETGSVSFGRNTRWYTVSYNSVVIYPDRGDDILELRYYPDLHPYSKISSQWRTWFDDNESQFQHLFTNYGLWGTLSQYENAILKKAVSGYVGAQLDKDQSYKALNDFTSAVNLAKDNKPQLYKLGMAQYHVSPY